MNTLQVLRWVHTRLDPIVPDGFERRLLDLYLGGRRLLYRGDSVYCPLCERTFDRWATGVREEVLSCPRCISSPRHRMLWLFLTGEIGIDPASRVLHVGPNFGLSRAFRGLDVEYYGADIDSPLADLRLDVTDIPDGFGPFDLVVCSHVLEHVDDDRQAMRELHDVLAPDGVALLQVPISDERETTYEDSDVTTPEERRRAYGHHDHRRLYGRDYPERLRQAGFTVEIHDYVSSIPPQRRQRLGLPGDRNIYVCRQ